MHRSTTLPTPPLHQYAPSRATHYIDRRPHLLSIGRSYFHRLSHRGVHEPHLDCPNSLSCFPDLNTKRPTGAISTLVRCAILGSRREQLSLKDIILALQEKFSFFCTIDGTSELERSIPHALAMNPCFVRAESCTGDLWAVAKSTSTKQPSLTIQSLPNPQFAVSISPPHPSASLSLMSGVSYPRTAGVYPDHVHLHDNPVATPYPATSPSSLAPYYPYPASTNRADYTFFVDENGDHPPHEDCVSSLRCLRDTNDKPNYIWNILLRAAILGSPERRLTLAGIYEEIENKFPYYIVTPTESWKQSVRHNLSRLNQFVRIERQAGDLESSSYWTVDLNVPRQASKRPPKRPKGAPLPKAKHQPEGRPAISSTAPANPPAEYGYPVPLLMPGIRGQPFEGPGQRPTSIVDGVLVEEGGTTSQVQDLRAAARSVAKSQIHAPPGFWY